jgi:YHS domain-containing protein
MKKFVLLIIATLFSILITNAQTALRSKQYNIENGLALNGYDPVAYFNQNKAMEGNKSIKATVEGLTYYFSTTSNKDLFLKDFRKYEPQYGGWCAYAMGSSGEKVEIDPETFKIINGKLYLFYHSWVNNTLTKWNEDEKNLKNKADSNWQKLIQ